MGVPYDKRIAGVPGPDVTRRLCSEILSPFLIQLTGLYQPLADVVMGYGGFESDAIRAIHDQLSRRGYSGDIEFITPFMVTWCLEWIRDNKQLISIVNVFDRHYVESLESGACGLSCVGASSDWLAVGIQLRLRELNQCWIEEGVWSDRQFYGVVTVSSRTGAMPYQQSNITELRQSTDYSNLSPYRNCVIS